jgi:hypothetical protein
MFLFAVIISQSYVYYVLPIANSCKSRVRAHSYCSADFGLLLAGGYPFEPPKMQFITKVWYVNSCSLFSCMGNLNPCGTLFPHTYIYMLSLIPLWPQVITFIGLTCFLAGYHHPIPLPAFYRISKVCRSHFSFRLT